MGFSQAQAQKRLKESERENYREERKKDVSRVVWLPPLDIVETSHEMFPQYLVAEAKTLEITLSKGSKFQL